jgi:hypothetical protein
MIGSTFNLSYPGESHKSNDCETYTNLAALEFWVREKFPQYEIRIHNGQGQVIEVVDYQNKGNILFSVPAERWLDGADPVGALARQGVQQPCFKLFSTDAVQVVLWANEGPEADLSVEAVNDSYDRFLAESLQQGGLKAGFEAEFYLLKQLAAQVSSASNTSGGDDVENSRWLAAGVSEWQQEHLAKQREYANPSPAATSEELFADLRHKLLTTCAIAQQNGDLVNLTGAPAEFTHPGESVTNPASKYVDFMSDVFLGTYIANGVPFWDDSLAQNLADLANYLGYSDVQDFLANSPRASIVGTNAGHISFSIPHFEGLVQPKLIQSILNAWNLLVDVLDRPTNSGCLHSGFQTTYEGELVESARKHIGRVLSTAIIPEMLPSAQSNNIIENQIEAITSGLTQSLDRGAIIADLGGYRTPAMHSIGRVRTSFKLTSHNLQVFNECLETGDFSALTAHYRIESTSADATPSLIHTQQSIELKKIVVLGSILAARAGFSDIFTWATHHGLTDLISKGNSGDSVSTVGRQTEVLRALVAGPKLEKLKYIEQLNDLVAAHLEAFALEKGLSGKFELGSTGDSIFTRAHSTIQTQIDCAYGPAKPLPELFSLLFSNPAALPSIGYALNRLLAAPEFLGSAVQEKIIELGLAETIGIPQVAEIAAKLNSAYADAGNKQTITMEIVRSAHRAELIKVLNHLLLINQLKK